MTVASGLGECVSVRGRFHRSVQLSKDWAGQGDSDYLLTPTVKDLTLRIWDELGRTGGVRAWSITGPYGTGKSSFALFLGRLLARQTEHPGAAELVPAGAAAELIPAGAARRKA